LEPEFFRSYLPLRWKNACDRRHINLAAVWWSTVFGRISATKEQEKKLFHCKGQAALWKKQSATGGPQVSVTCKDKSQCTPNFSESSQAS
jgi:hypothetical protein